MLIVIIKLETHAQFKLGSSVQTVVNSLGENVYVIGAYQNSGHLIT